jgi:hypothetical protein
LTWGENDRRVGNIKSSSDILALGLEARLSSVCSDAGTNACVYVSEVVDRLCRGELVPLKLHGFPQFTKGCGSVCAHSVLECVPQILDGIEIGRVWWPHTSRDVAFSEVCCCCTCCVWPRIILHECEARAKCFVFPKPRESLFEDLDVARGLECFNPQ